MKRKQHSAEEMTRKLREADAAWAGGATVAEASRQLVSDLSRWRQERSTNQEPELSYGLVQKAGP